MANKIDDRELYYEDLMRIERRGRSTINRWVRVRYLPAPHGSGPGGRRAAWYESEILEWRKRRDERARPRQTPPHEVP
jgi:predicted DNA-binding transcriptional regulator AlpA